MTALGTRLGSGRSRRRKRRAAADRVARPPSLPARAGHARAACLRLAPLACWSTRPRTRPRASSAARDPRDPSFEHRKVQGQKGAEALADHAVHLVLEFDAESRATEERRTRSQAGAEHV